MRTKYEDRELKTNNPSDNLLEGVGEYWGGFYNANPHRFALDYFEFPLHIFQQVLLYFMFKSDLFLMSCTRGLRQDMAYIRLLCCYMYIKTWY